MPFWKNDSKKKLKKLKKKFEEIKKQRDLFYIFYEHFTNIMNVNRYEDKENQDIIMRYNFSLLGDFFSEYMNNNCDLNIDLNDETKETFMGKWKKIVKEHQPKLKELIEKNNEKENVRYIG